MVFKKSKLKLFLEEKNTIINITFALLFIILVSSFYRETIDECEGAASLLSKALSDYSRCTSDTDCYVQKPVSDNCKLSGSCALTLNTPLKPYYLADYLVMLKTINCEKDCTSVCSDYKKLLPKCYNNNCDYALP